MILSDWNHIFFVNCSASMFSASMQLENQSCKRGGEPRVKYPPNSRSATGLYSEAARKGASTGLPRVFPNGRREGGGDVQMTDALHDSNWSFFLWIIFPTCFVLSVVWTLFNFNSTTYSYCCITVWRPRHTMRQIAATRRRDRLL